MEEVGGWSFTPHTGVWTARWYEDARHGRVLSQLTVTERTMWGRTLHVEYAPHLVRMWYTETGHVTSVGITLAEVFESPGDHVLCPRCFFRRPGPEPDPRPWMHYTQEW